MSFVLLETICSSSLHPFMDATPTPQPQLLSKETLSFVADILSLVGFFLTLAVFIGLRSIKNYYVLKGRLPDLIETLDTYASRLSTLSESEEEASEREVRLIMERTKVALGSLKKMKLNKEAKASIKTFASLINRYNTPSLPGARRPSGWDLYTKMSALADELRALQKEKEWER